MVPRPAAKRSRFLVRGMPGTSCMARRVRFQQRAWATLMPALDEPRPAREAGARFGGWIDDARSVTVPKAVRSISAQVKDIPRPAGELLHLIERTPRAADVLAGLEVFKAARAEAIGVRRQSVPLAGRGLSRPGGGARTAAQTGDTAFAIPRGAAGLSTSTPNARFTSACKVPTAAASLFSSTPDRPPGPSRPPEAHPGRDQRCRHRHPGRGRCLHARGPDARAQGDPAPSVQERPGQGADPDDRSGRPDAQGHLRAFPGRAQELPSCSAPLSGRRRSTALTPMAAASTSRTSTVGLRRRFSRRAAQVLPAVAGDERQALLREAPGLPQARQIAADRLARIHPPRVGRCRLASSSYS